MSVALGTNLEAVASMFDAQTLAGVQRASSTETLNVTPVLRRVASFSYRGILEGIYEHLTDVRVGHMSVGLWCPAKG